MELLSFEGRINRMTYFLNYLAGTAVLLIVYLVAFMVAAVAEEASVLLLFMLPTYLAAAIYGLSLSTRRLHDLGHSGWLILVGLIPLVGIVFWLWVLFAGGQPQSNKYGPPATEFRWLFQGQRPWDAA